MQIVLATHNRNKIIEMKKVLKKTNLEILSLDDFPNMPDVVEDGKTLEENSLKKAKEIFEYTNITSLADDTGLEVLALNGEPGVYSARYAGESCNFQDNCELLLKNLKNKKNRSACFRTVMTLYGTGIKEVAVGVVQGKITTDFLGDEGFGYDPIFQPNGYNVTFSQMSLEDKNNISHRGLALKEMLKILKNY